MDQCASTGSWEDERVRQMAEQADQLLSQLETMEVYHPYGDVERMRDER